MHVKQEEANRKRKEWFEVQNTEQTFLRAGLNIREGAPTTLPECTLTTVAYENIGLWITQLRSQKITAQIL